MDVPLEILDREVSAARAELQAARAVLFRGADAETPNPLAGHRQVSTRAAHAALADAQGPLAAPLRSWVHALTLERVLWPDTVRLAAAWRERTIAVAAAGVSPLVASPRDLLVRILGEAEPARRRIFADALARGAGSVHDAARILAERRAEASRLLGAGLDDLEIPVDPPQAIGGVAARFLAQTRDLVERARAWPDALGTAIGREYAEGWPARLNVRWMFELFGKSPLVEGLRLVLAPLPAALGAASFARALGAFGAALAEARAPASPCAGVRAPFDPRSHRRAALFASLAADPVFGVRALGLGRGPARDQARGIARALLVGARLDAARVLLRGVLGRPAGELSTLFEEHTNAALGAPVDASLAGVVPRLGPDDPARFVGLLLAARDRRALIERFDEDWFQSPHAARAIREEDADASASVAARPTPAAALDAGVVEIGNTLGALA